MKYQYETLEKIINFHDDKVKSSCCHLFTKFDDEELEKE